MTDVLSSCVLLHATFVEVVTAVIHGYIFVCVFFFLCIVSEFCVFIALWLYNWSYNHKAIHRT
jgi:hypothetical protein